MKNQLMLLGIFLILIGVLIFVYWILLPISEKEKLLQEIYGKENISKVNYTQSYEQKERSLSINNIYLYSGKKEIIISENYTIGELIIFYEQELEDIFIKTNIFSGIKSKKITFSYYESEGILVSFISKCENGKLEILVNDIPFFEGCTNGLQNFFVQKEYLNKNNNFILIKFYPNSLFSDAELNIKNLKINFVKRSEITFEYFYNYNEDVYLIYNFCPTDPNALELYINDVKVPLYSCSHNSFEITKYLNKGRNIINVKSKVKTKIDLKISTTSNIYTQIFNLTKKDYMLYVIKNRGSGEIYINTCKFYLDSLKNVFTFFVNEECINNGENILIVRPNIFLEISSLILQ